MAPFDSTGFEVSPKVEHDLSTGRGRLLYLRDVVVPAIPYFQLNMEVVDCGTAACLCGWALRDPVFWTEAVAPDTVHTAGNADDWFLDTDLCKFFGITYDQERHLFYPHAYGGQLNPSRKELVEHLNDVLDGRV